METNVISADGRVIAVVFRTQTFDPQADTVVERAGGNIQRGGILDDNLDMNVSVLNGKAGFSGPAHYHPNDQIPYSNDSRSQIKFIITGRIQINLFTTDGTACGSIELETGDGVQLFEGHQVDFLEETRMLSIESGPTVDGDRSIELLEENPN